MGYMFEEIIRRFSENASAGDHYTPREVIRLLTSILLAEGCSDIFSEGREVTVLDMACGTVTVIEVVVISLTVTGTDIPSKVTVTEFLSVPKPFPVNVISCPAFTNVPLG